MSLGLITAVLLVTLVLAVVAVATLAGNMSRERELAFAGGSNTERRGVVVRGWLDGWVRRTTWGRRLGALLAGAGLSWGPLGFLVRAGALGAGSVALVYGFVGKIGSAVVLVLVVVGLKKWLEYRRTKRIEHFIGQLPELARILANSAAAGLAVRRGLELAAREMEEPASGEIEQVVGQLAVGQTLEKAMREMQERLPSRELLVLVQTLVIQSRAGGALGSALSGIAATLDERRELRREVRTAVMGVVFGGYTVIGIALSSVLLLNLISPGALDEMVTNPIGQVALAAAGIFFTAGFWLMGKFTKVDV
ncbi:type II secretion system F family protein [Pengzhenrongella frigida]|uniref:Type II secretion system protein GspF domain-containing protein n=1 Tax=Pengzhenrongella frigida TaxID=1259133 RepID=A0A4Q5N200_9MICO|nr:type II secretion system F family protein [Cellulomonas sp. HLT2-17]RYV52222.1 hypothetical protein EUA98_04435 [Cellulomonas sp. HLT2-17]